MTHDPLCPQQPRADGATLQMLDGKVIYCACDLISKVRANKREFVSGMWIGWCIGTAFMIPVVVTLAVWR